MILLAHHQLLLAIPFAGPVLGVFAVLAYINLRDRARRRS